MVYAKKSAQCIELCTEDIDHFTIYGELTNKEISQKLKLSNS